MANPTVLNKKVLPQKAGTPAQNVLLSTAMTSTKTFEGTDTAGTALALLYTVGSNEGIVPDILINYASTTGAAASGTSNATVVRVFTNNGSANTTATNNALVRILAIPAQDYTNIHTAAVPTFRIAMDDMNLPADWRIYVGIATAMGGTNCALHVACDGAGGNFS